MMMSKKRKLESLQALGVLKPQDVKQIQSALGQSRVEASHISMANIRWGSLVVVIGLSYASLAGVIGIAWRLSH